MPDVKPACYAYTRVSTLDQADSGLGLAAQRRACEEFWRTRLADSHRWGGVFQDAAVSARKHFLRRKAGGELDRRLMRGDAVVFSKLDRGFRNLMDMLATVKRWEDCGVKFVMLDHNVDTGTASGKMMLQMLGMFAEFERNRMSERTKEGLARRTKRVDPKTLRHRHGVPPLGFVWSPVKGDPVPQPFPAERAQMAEILRLRDERRSVEEIYYALRFGGVMNLKTGEFWSRERIRRALHHEPRLRREEAAARAAAEGTT